MSAGLEGVITVVLAMLTVGALALCLIGIWLGARRVRRGQWRRAFWMTNALIGLNSGFAIMVLLADSRFQDDPWQWMLAGVGGPLLLGYALGTSWGLLRGPKPPSA